MNFDYFQIQKWILQTVRAEKVDEKKNKKKCGQSSSFHVSFLSYGLQIVEKSAYFRLLCRPQQET